MGIHLEFSGAILIDSLGRFLFQQRDNNPEILYPGMIGLFGGHREGNENVSWNGWFARYTKKSAASCHRNALRMSSGTQGLRLWLVSFHCEIYVANNIPVDNY